MKRTDCKWYEAVVEQESEFDYILVDEVCYQDKMNYKHHDEYDCKDCKKFIKED
jgi:hypothetical protein